MNPKVLIIGGIAVMAFSLMSFASKATAITKEIFKQIKFRISSIKRVRIADGKLKFDLDVTLENPTPQEFSVSTSGIIKAKVFRIYRNNNLLAYGTMNNFNKIQLLPGGRFVFSDIEMQIPLLGAGTEILSILTNGGGLSDLPEALNNIDNIDWEIIFNQLRYEIDIEAFGEIYTFKK